MFERKLLIDNSIPPANELSLEELRKGWGDWVGNAYVSMRDAEKGSYSLITLNQVLEHVRRPLPFLQHISEYLAKDGILFMEVPHRDDLYKSWVGPHILFWEKRSLVSVLGKAGMDIVFCKHLIFSNIYERAIANDATCSLV